MYEAAPTDFIRQFQLEMIHVEQIVLTRCNTIPFIHFNCVMNFGIAQPATETLLDQLLTIYHEAGVRHFALYHIPQAQPSVIPEWFRARKLQQRGGWDRIYRDGRAVTEQMIKPQQGVVVEKVTQTTAAEWAGYIDGCYGLPTTPWLASLVERPGWHHYLLRRDTEIVAVRTMYITADMAWFGIDAPVPGVMAPSYDLDVQLCHTMVKDGLDLGVRLFVADIEAPDAAMTTPAYQHFARLGFKRPYFRSHYSY
jgi:hypothetical protein